MGRVATFMERSSLISAGGNTSQFVYGADGLRRTSIVNGNPVHYVLDSGMMVRELRAEGQELRASATYLIGPRGPEYRRNDATGQTMWYLYDGLGSVLAEIDALGNMTTPRKYDVYGLVRAGDSGTSRHKFVGSLGHTSEDETGLIYMRARWMDPSLGRFISEDPARDGANWFEYCRGNPVNAVDRDGCYSELLRDLVVSVAGNYVWTQIAPYVSSLAGLIHAASCKADAAAALVGRWLDALASRLIGKGVAAIGQAAVELRIGGAFGSVGAALGAGYAIRSSLLGASELALGVTLKGVAAFMMYGVAALEAL